MSKIRTIAAAAAILASVSCSSYYQIATLSSDEVSMAEDGDFAQKAGEITIHYDFWSNCGAVSFTVENRSDRDITLDLSRSFFVRNGTAYDYFLHRTFVTTTTSSVSHGRAVSTGRTNGSYASAGAAAAVGTLYGDAAVSIGASASEGVSTNISGISSSSSSLVRSRCLEIEEAAECIIPAHSSKNFGEYSVASGEYARCGLVRNPSKNEKSEINFNAGNSPFVIENRLTFVIAGEDTPVVSTFHVSSIQNMKTDNALRNADSKDCMGKQISSNYPVRYNIYKSADRYYVTYGVIQGEENGRTR